MFVLSNCIMCFYCYYKFLWFSLQAPDNRARCAKFIKQCLEFLEEPDHMVTLHLGKVCNYFSFFIS